MSQEGKSIVGTRERPERLQEGKVADFDAPLDATADRKTEKTFITYQPVHKTLFFQYSFKTNEVYFLMHLLGTLYVTGQIFPVDCTSQDSYPVHIMASLKSQSGTKIYTAVTFSVQKICNN